MTRLSHTDFDVPQQAILELHARAKLLAAYSITLREADVSHWLTLGKTNPEIAIILQISPRTVEKHMEKILEKLGVENRTAAAMIIAKI
jgi:DNA-binding CsgD family transcriptional regulator